MQTIAPDSFVFADGNTLPGQYIAAAIGGYLNSVPAHQPLTRLSLETLSEVTDSLYKFSEDNLDTIANGGVTVIAQDSSTSKPYIRHELSTDVTDLKTYTPSIKRNLDNISYGIKDIVVPYIGKYNNHPGVLERISTQIEGYLYSKTESVTESSGPQLLGYEDLIVEQHATESDKVVVSVTLELPSPINYINVTLTI